MSEHRRVRRELGQNFLVDGGAIRRILEAAAPVSGEAVLEIGPGRGALTEGLIASVGRIAAVEIDPRLAEALQRRHAGDRLLMFPGDVLRLDLATVLQRLRSGAQSRLVIVGNLPYSISKPLAMKLIGARDLVDRAVLMFQREVAERLVALPGSKSYGPLAVLASLTFAIERLFDLRPGAFRPRPRVDSTVTRWRPRHPPVIEPQRERALRECLRASFARRRQTLRNNLRHAVGSELRVDALLRSARLDGSLRAEAVVPQGFVRLAESWENYL